MSITAQQYGDFDFAYTQLNKALFNNQLPDCFITVNKKPNSAGYFRNSEFVDNDGRRTDEISLNYSLFLYRSTGAVLSTLIHEMCHQWQFHHGKNKPRQAYHNKEWADKMEKVGLMPSHDGQKGGKKTGQNMTHYIIQDGKAYTEIQALIDSGFKIKWTAHGTAQMIKYKQENPDDDTAKYLIGGELGDENASDLDRELGGEKAALEDVEPALPASKTKTTSNSKTKFTCPECNQNAWAKPSAFLKCGLCDIDMEINE